MTYRKIVTFSYLAILIVCAFTFSNNARFLEDVMFNKSIEIFEYQLSNPTLYSLKDEGVLETVIESEEKVIYLTFDDGPSPRTDEILDVLKKYDVKATFFITTPKEKEYSEYLIRAYEEGHSIGIHTASHKYNEIYESVETYLADFDLAIEYINDTINITPKIFRFPGGSVNGYNDDIIIELVDEMTRRGFIYFDWNVESNDSNANLSANSIYKNVINGVEDKNIAVVIMHDSFTRKTTPEALDSIIKTLLEEGWFFKSLDETVKPIQFKIK